MILLFSQWPRFKCWTVTRLITYQINSVASIWRTKYALNPTKANDSRGEEDKNQQRDARSEEAVSELPRQLSFATTASKNAGSVEHAFAPNRGVLQCSFSESHV